jgi:hypothetical protein
MKALLLDVSFVMCHQHARLAALLTVLLPVAYEFSEALALPVASLCVLPVKKNYFRIRAGYLIYLLCHGPRAPKHESKPDPRSLSKAHRVL